MKPIPSIAFLLLTLLRLRIVVGAKVLMTSTQMPSRIILQLKLGSELVRRGHDVHIAVGSRYPAQKTFEKLGIKPEFFHVPNDVVYGVSREFEKLVAESVFNDRPTLVIREMSTMVNRDCEFMMADEQFLARVRSLNFDIAVVEPFLLSQCTLILPHYLGISFVSMSSCFRPWQTRIPAFPSFHFLINPFQAFDDSTLLGRMENLVTYVIFEFSIFFPGARNTTLLERFAPELNSWTELVAQSQLHLIDSDHHVGSALPTFPNVVSIAGLTCSPPKRLGQDFEMIMSKGDAIVMSFGSMAFDAPEHVILKFMQAFSRLNESVVARLPRLEGVEVPKNVKLGSWIPQNDLLSHPNTKLFITHCGTNGLHETLYHGVPIIGFPLFAEHSLNCRSAAKKDFGLVLNIHSFTSEELYAAIVDVIMNSTYRQTMKRASRVFRDQQTSPQERAVYWIQHVIKHGGSHLRSPVIDMPLRQFLMLDILAVLFVSMCCLTFLAKVILAQLCRRLINFRKRVIKLKPY